MADLGLRCLPMSNKKAARLIWVKADQNKSDIKIKNKFWDIGKPTSEFVVNM